MGKLYRGDLSGLVSKYAKEEFSERDFIYLLLHYMNKNGIETIFEDEFCRQLVPYKINEKYKHLFSSIVFKRNEDRVIDLYESISELKISGGLWWTSIDRNTLHINLSNKVIEWYLEGKKENDIDLIKEIAHQFSIRNKFDKGGKGKLVIYGLDPNKEYILGEGKHVGTVTWQLITDGIIEGNEFREPKDSSYWNNPRNKYHSGLGLSNQHVRKVKIKDATYTIKQGLMDSIVECAELCTQSLDEDYLSQLSKHSLSDCTSNGIPLTEENPHVYSLKINHK